MRILSPKVGPRTVNSFMNLLGVSTLAGSVSYEPESFELILFDVIGAVLVVFPPKKHSSKRTELKETLAFTGRFSFGFWFIGFVGASAGGGLVGADLVQLSLSMGLI